MTKILDRVLSLYLYYPLLKNLYPLKNYIPILMYHSLSKANKDHKHPYYSIYTSPEIFASHMRYLYESGYKILSILDVINLLTKPDSFIPERCVAITFDDGYRNFISEAYPILKKYNFTATVFIPTGHIGKKGYLEWDEVKELSKKNIYFGSHTVTHPQLTLLGNTAVQLRK